MTVWTERSVGRLIVRVLFQRRVLAVPNCTWTGDECDLLVVEPRLRLIDVEIKVCRADLVADGRKDKWWRGWTWGAGGRVRGARRTWPQSVWKHYYCLPAEVWSDGLLDVVSPASGVLVIETVRAAPRIRVVRRVTANRDAKPISPADCVDIARLAGLRMWDALAEVDRLRGVVG